MRRSRRIRTLPASLALAAALTLAGCGSSGDGTEAGATTTPTQANGGQASGVSSDATPVPAGDADGAGTTTTAPPGSSSTTARSSTSSTTTAAYAPATIDPQRLPAASACSPGPGDLPDGLYFGFARATLDDVFEFDLACWFTGEPAVKAAAEDGKESPPPNDYHIRNTNSTTRSVIVAGPDVTVQWLPATGNPATEAVTYNEWVSLRDPEGPGAPGIWILVRGGVVTEIAEQWVP